MSENDTSGGGGGGGNLKDKNWLAELSDPDSEQAVRNRAAMAKRVRDRMAREGNWSLGRSELEKLSLEFPDEGLAELGRARPGTLKQLQKASAKGVIEKLATTTSDDVLRALKVGGKAALRVGRLLGPATGLAGVALAPLTTEALGDESEGELLRQRAIQSGQIPADWGVPPVEERPTQQVTAQPAAQVSKATVPSTKKVSPRQSKLAAQKKILSLIQGVSEGLDTDDMASIKQQLDESLHKDGAIAYGRPDGKNVLPLKGSIFEDSIRSRPDMESLLGPAAAIVPDKLSPKSKEIVRDLTTKMAKRGVSEADPNAKIGVHDWQKTEKMLEKYNMFERSGVQFSEGETMRMEAVRANLDKALAPVVDLLKNNIKSSNYGLPSRAAGGIIPLKTLPESVLKRLNIPDEDFQRMYLRENELPYDVKAYLGLHKKPKHD